MSASTLPSIRAACALAAIAVAVVVVIRFLGQRPESADAGSLRGSSIADARAPEAIDALPWIDETTPERVLVPGMKPASAAVPEPAPAPSLPVLNVRTILKDTGRPVSGIRVLAARSEWEGSANDTDRSRGKLTESLTTDSDGRVVIAVEPALDLYLSVSPPNESARYESRQVPALAADETREVVIELVTSADIVLCGKLVDRETGAPISGARVGPSRTFSRIPADLATAAPEGRFCCSYESWKYPGLTVLADGYEPAILGTTTAHATEAEALVVPLARAASLRVRVLDSTGKAIAKARVDLTTDWYRLRRSEDSWSSAFDASHPIWEATTDSEGHALVTSLPPRAPLDGRASSWGQSIWTTSEPIVLEPGEQRDVVWRQGSAATILGRVLELDGRPVPSQKILLEPASHEGTTYFGSSPKPGARMVESDSVGRFTFADAGAGSWWIGPARSFGDSATTIAPFGQRLEVPAGAANVDVEIRVHRGLAISGKVVDPDGAPVKQIFLSVSGVDSPSWYTDAQRDEEGHFHVGYFVAGEYDVIASSPSVTLAASRPVRVRAGASDVVLRLSAGERIHGIVRDRATGRPIEAEVTCSSGRGFDRGWSINSTSPEGEFTVGGLRAGTYDLAACTSDGRVGILAGVAVASGTANEGRDILVEPGSKISVHYVGPKDVGQVQVLRNDVAVTTDGVEKGTQLTLRAPAGKFVVRMLHWPEREIVDIELDLAAGSTRDLVFDGAWK